MENLTRAVIWEDSSVTFLARIRGATGAYLTQASLSSIAYKVFDLDGDTPGTLLSSGTATIASSVYDTLQTDDIWTKDTTGYNFSHTLAATAFPTGNHAYRVQYVFMATSGAVFTVVFEVTARDVLGG